MFISVSSPFGARKGEVSTEMNEENGIIRERRRRAENELFSLTERVGKGIRIIRVEEGSIKGGGWF